MSDDITSLSVQGVGTSRQRPDAEAKVRGGFEYATDLHEDGMLWGATLRSPHPLARILNVDLAPAKAIPGVAAVLGAWDVSENRFGAINRDQPVLADDHVRYVGEPIAIVAASDPETARRALRAIEVSYEPLAPVIDPLDALARGHIHRHVKYAHGDPTIRGEVEVEGEYFTARQDHSFMAPDGGLARPDGHGGVEIIGATQWVHADRSQIAFALGLPEEKVLVRNAGVGGSFGGRVSMTWQIHGALLALHTNRPVKFLYSRQETFHARYHRHPSRIWIRHHANRDGLLVKLEARILYEGGPYSHTSAAGIGNGSTLIQGPYHIPNATIEGWAVATNNGMCGPLRGFGVVQAIYACESNMDKLARELKVDPVELRMRNALRNDDRWIFNQAQDRPTPVRELIAKCQAKPLPDQLPDDHRKIHPVRFPGGIASPSRPEHIKRGVALAAAVKNVCLSEGAPVNSTAMVSLRDGVATIDCAAAEVGQGFVAIAEQIVQSVLGVSDVRLNPADTSMPPAATTDGSQQTVTSGTAVHHAATRVKERFLRVFSRERGLDPSLLDMRDGHVVDKAGNRLASIVDAGQGLIFRATERFDQRATRPVDDPDSDAPVHVTFGFSANRCVVDVDVELGLVKVVQMDVAQDIGFAVNPLQAHGQIEGGSVQGMGLALMEHLKAEDGHLLNPDWRSYHIPTIVDAPEIKSELVFYPEPDYPFGWKGMAELPHVQAPPAVLAAVRAATGLDLPAAPATPKQVSGIAAESLPMALHDAREDERRGPWKVAPGPRKTGPWSPS
ncbi:MAG: molybdopterin cofactor-binding domain-containing protein [Hyphomicrobiales bacterium]